MKKLTIFAIIFLLSNLSSAQFFAPNQKPALGFKVNGGHPLSKGLVGLWLFNEGSGNKVFDLSGNGNTGTFQGTATAWGSDKHGPTIVFPGTDEYISIPHNSVLKPSFPFTVVGRVKANKTNGFLFLSDMQANYAGYKIQLYTGIGNESVYTRIGNNTGAGSTGRSDYWRKESYITTGEWFDIAVVFNSVTDRFIHINGDAGEAAVLASGTASTMVYSSSGSNIGSDYTQFDDVEVSYVMIYNRALSASEIALLHREPFCMIEPSWNWINYVPFLAAPAAGNPQVIFITN